MISGAFGQISSLADHATVLQRPAFSEHRLGRYVVAWSEPLPQLLPLECNVPALIDPWVGQFHSDGHNQASRDISCYFARDIGLSNCGHLYVDKNVVLSDELVPFYWREIVLKTNGLQIDLEYALPERVIEEPTLVISGYGVQVYGHFLIESLPKLMVARRALGGDLSRLKLLLPTITPSWFKAILVDVFSIRPEQFIFYNPEQERLLLKLAVIPTLASFDGWFHPFANSIFDETARLIGPEADFVKVPKILLSRALFGNSASAPRRCLNEFRLAEIAVKEFGFSIIAAETLPWRVQVGMFRNAEVVVGECGSGLHSALFSRPGTVIGAIGINSFEQSKIGALRRQRNAYIRADQDEAGTYSISESIFRDFLAELVSM